MAEPLVSVTLPVHNGERYLAEAIESVLAQTWTNTELVIVDDGSTDGSREIARSYPATLIEQENRGVAAARNVGVGATAGEVLAFIDQDDVYVPHKLEHQLEELGANPDLGISMCQMEFSLEPGHDMPDWLFPWHEGVELPTWQLGCLAIRREAFEFVGPFDSSYRWCSDADWFTRSRDAGVPVRILEETLMRYRVHDGNESGRAPTGGMRDEQFRVLRESIQRKREAAQRG